MPSGQTGTVPAACWGTGMSWEGRGQSKRGLSPCLYQQTQPESPRCPADPSLGAHTDPTVCPRPHTVHSPAEDTVKVSRAVAGGAGQGLQE